MNWDKDCAYDEEQKKQFHRIAKRRLKLLANELGFDNADFDLRSNQGGIAVSGEVTLHHERIYIQVSQFGTCKDLGILVRTCEGRRDYTGGMNNFFPLTSLDDRGPLITFVKSLLKLPVLNS
jgi:hypothetical protein